jgi:hypothetical protein
VFPLAAQSNGYLHNAGQKNITHMTAHTVTFAIIPSPSTILLSVLQLKKLLNLIINFTLFVNFGLIVYIDIRK